MRLFITITITSLVTLLLLNSGSFLNKIDIHFHENGFINGMVKYQSFALILGILTLFFFLILYPESKQFLSIGDISKIAEKEKWIGIDGKTTWFKNAWQLLIFISLGTGIFMYLGVKYSSSLGNFTWWFLPLALAFSLSNSFVEEIIYRFGIIAGLGNDVSKPIILLISAVMFGLPHYFGNPSGVIGVLMSAVLGYILCKASIETKGISIAWIIHFFQDVIIFVAIMMMNAKK